MTSRSTSQRLKKTRDDHSREIAEDYVEMIADLIHAEQVCRVTGLARRMGVSHVTASRTVNRLVEAGLARTSPHQPITLTPKGTRLANAARRRHQVVLEFLKEIGVSERIADSDAEGIEHHCSPETIAAMSRFIDAAWSQR